jgi:hypothetical protein
MERSHTPHDVLETEAGSDPVSELSALEAELSSTTWLAGSARRRLADRGTKRRRRSLMTPPPFRAPGVQTKKSA